MNTKDIEEIVEEMFDTVYHTGEQPNLNKDWLRNTLTTLTQHHQAEVEKAVEAVESLKMGYVTDDDYVQKIFDEVQRMPLAGMNPHYQAGAKHGYNRAISHAKNISENLLAPTTPDKW